MSMRAKLFLSLAVIALIVILLAIFVYAYQQRAPAALPRKSQTPTEQLIATLIQTRTRLATTTSTALDIQLAQAYLQQVRETADVALYHQVDTLMTEAAAKDPDNIEVILIRAAVAAGRHDFQAALAFAQQALTQDLLRTDAYGLLVDGLTELGRYAEAERSLQTMVDIRPDMSAFQRVSYQRELRGDVEDALVALDEAILAGSRVPEHLAWTHVERGNLRARQDLEKARQDYERAQTLMRRAYPPALAGLGRVAFFNRDTTKASEYFEQALAALPVTHHAIDLGDSYLANHEDAKAKQYYALANLAFEASSSSGVNVDLEHALFLADHDLQLPLALSKARRAYAERPSIFGADALAWTLYKHGDHKEAQKILRQALRLGEHDPLILFHAGMIAKTNGNMQEAKRLLTKALQLHPRFSIQHVQTAKEALNSL